MKKYQSKHFGEIIISDSEAKYLDFELELNNKVVLIELEVEDQNIDQTKIQAIDNYLDTFQANHEIIKSGLLSMLNQEGFVRDYISMIKEDLEEEIQELIDNIDSKSIEERLLSKLYICRLEFLLSEEKGRFAIIDFTIDEELTGDLLVVGIQENNEIVYTTIES